MMLTSSVVLFLTLTLLIVVNSDNCTEDEERSSDNGNDNFYQHIVIGAGVSGLQMGYLLSQTYKEYTVLEKNSHAGSFFDKYPRNNVLLSINKRFTGFSNYEYNLRHDWNSLLSPRFYPSDPECNKKFKYNINRDDKFLFSNFSTDYYPNKSDLKDYLVGYGNCFKLNIKYNSEVLSISRLMTDTDNYKLFVLDVKVKTLSQTSSYELNKFYCKYLFIATGLHIPYVPKNINNIEYAIGYESFSMNLTHYENKSIAIIGGKNSGFEVGQYVSQVSAFTHILMNEYPSFAWETHYVGDLRGINMEFIDHYLLKSLDAPIGGNYWSNNIDIIKNKKDEKYYIVEKNQRQYNLEWNNKHPNGNDRPWELREGYDIIIRCTGFKFDYSIFDNQTIGKYIYSKENKNDKFPLMNNKYEAINVSNLYFLGVIMHKNDYKKTAGGFIHGFRYLVQALYYHIFKDDLIKYNRITINNNDISKYLLIRINSASSFYQMFGFMADFITINTNTSNTTSSYYYTDLLITQISDLPLSNNNITDCLSIISLTFDYHIDFHGYDKVYKNPNRVHNDYKTGQHSKFLHPILRQYSCNVVNLKSEKTSQKAISQYLIAEKHIIEDFLIKWDSKTCHIDWLNQWIYNITNIEQNDFHISDLNSYYC